MITAYYQIDTRRLIGGREMNGYSIESLTGELVKIPALSHLAPEMLFGKIPFFSDVVPDMLQRISRKTLIRIFSGGDVVCRHGMFNEYFHIILSGTAAAFIPTEENPRYELYSLGPNDFFGEEILFSREPRENSIIARDRLLTLALAPDDIKMLMEGNENIRSLLDQNYISRKLRKDLRSVPVFSHLNDNLFEEVLALASLESCRKGETVFREKDFGDAFYLIRTGEVEIFRSRKKNDTLISILGEGEFFGEMALLTSELRNGTVVVSSDADLVKISRDDFLNLISRDSSVSRQLSSVVDERRRTSEEAMSNPHMPFINQRLIILNRMINRHLDILSQCAIETEKGSALLATLPGSRYPYVYPRDSACASRFLYQLTLTPIKAGNTAFRLLSEIARFILNCQRADGYWGQRYGIKGEDKGIYRQEDNVAHGVTILCRYLLAAHRQGKSIPDLDRYIDSISRGAAFARNNYYRNEIHLFFSTTSIHESAIEEGYSIWVNFAYLLMLRLIEKVCLVYHIGDRFPEDMSLKAGFEATLDKVFSIGDRYVRRLRPEGIADLRPDITLLSPFFFNTGMEDDWFRDNDIFRRSVEFLSDNLWDPDLGMLQRYLPFIEDPDTHIHAGNGPWIQYTAMLAQYYYHTGDLEKGDGIMNRIDSYQSREGHLCEHLTTPERFFEFKRLEWIPGHDYEKEFEDKILVPGLPYDHIVEELNHMKNAYAHIEEQITAGGPKKFISFATPLMWSHAEYAMALLMKAKKELERYSYTLG